MRILLLSQIVLIVKVTGTGKYVGGIGYNGYNGTGDYGTAKIINSHNTESGSVSGNFHRRCRWLQ